MDTADRNRPGKQRTPRADATRVQQSIADLAHSRDDRHSQCRMENESDVGVESVSSHAFVYTDAAAATSALASYRDLVSRCTRWENGKSPSGRPATFGEQELFDAPAGEESVARQSGIVHPYFTGIPTFRTYWVASRVGQSIVQITYDPEWPLDTKQGREKANGLAAVAAANVENHSE